MLFAQNNQHFNEKTIMQIISKVPSARSQGTCAMIVVNLAKSWFTIVHLARSRQIMINEVQGDTK